MENLNKLLYILSKEKYVEFLTLLSRKHSILSASKEASVSYRKAWEIVSSLKKIFGDTIFVTKVGGERGGGTFLTEDGSEILNYILSIKNSFRGEFNILHDGNLKSLINLLHRMKVRTSARNQLYGIVTETIDKGIVVKLKIDVEELPFITYVTKRSFHDLGLSCGKEVFILIKAPWVKIVDNCNGENCFEGKVVRILKEEGVNGFYVEVDIEVSPFLSLTGVTSADCKVRVGERVKVYIPPEEIIIGV